MKLSLSLSEMIMPLFETLGQLPETLFLAIKKAGKRGNGTYYPTDLRRVRVILETVSDLTGQTFEVEITEGDFASGIAKLSALLWEEEHLAEMGDTYALVKW